MHLSQVQPSTATTRATHPQKFHAVSCCLILVVGHLFLSNAPSGEPPLLHFLCSSDGIRTWGATIMNSTPSAKSTNGTELWTLPGSFRKFLEVHIWIDAQGNSKFIDHSKIPRAPFCLGAACSCISLETELGTNVCEDDACGRGDCCWNTTAESPCTTCHSECGNYAKCSNLLDLDDDDEIPPVELSKACWNHVSEAASGDETAPL